MCLKEFGMSVVFKVKSLLLVACGEELSVSSTSVMSSF